MSYQWYLQEPVISNINCYKTLILCIDIGNTRTKVAIFKKNEVVHFTAKVKWLVSDFKKLINKFQVQKSIISTVKKSKPRYFKYLNKNTQLIEFSHKTPIPIKNKYGTPKTLGRDRLAAVIGAHACFPKKNNAVIDIGTCVKFDFIDKNGTYWGGNIAPGVEMRLKAMHHFTAALPSIKKKKSKNLLGLSTSEAINNGAVLGVVFEIESFISRLKAEKGSINVILTGGGASFFGEIVKSKIFVVKKIINIILFSVPLFVFGQSLNNVTPEIDNPSINSPYSRFGLGDQLTLDHSFIYHMGGLSAAYNDKYNTNIVNPASLPYLKATAFETGLNARSRELKEGEDTYSNWSGGLSYFSLAFPLANPINDLLDRVERKYDLGMAISVSPNTLVGYDIISNEDSNGVEDLTRRFLGSGGTYSAQWGTGIKYNDFSAGINLGYVFGKISSTRVVNFGNVNSFNNYERIVSHITGFTWNLGVQYNYVLNKAQLKEDDSASTKSVTIGAYGAPGTNLKTSNDQEFLLVRVGSNVQPLVDTLNFSDNLEGTSNLPTKFGVGFNFKETLKTGEDKWSAGFNYESQLWSNYENSINPTELNNGSRISFGGFYRPNPRSLSNYFKRIYYQVGFFYAQDPVIVKGENVTQNGLTFGLGMPFITKRKVSNANVGVTLGTRGINTAVEERYLQLNFGFTFNSNEWFLKRKYQ